MALRLATGFDGLQTSDLTGIFTTIDGAGCNVGSSIVRTAGGRSLTCDFSNGAYLTNAGGSRTTGVIGAAVYLGGAGNSAGIFGFADSGTMQCSLHVSAIGLLEVRVGAGIAMGSGGTLLATSIEVLGSNQWTYLEFKATMHGSTGSFYARINEIPCTWTAANTGRNTIATANASFNQISVQSPVGSGATYVDDLVFIDNDVSDPLNALTDFLGDVRIVCRQAQPDATSGAGAFNDSTPSTGTDRGANVDETTSDGDTTYNSLTTAGNKDLYKHPVVGITGLVKAVTVRNLVKKSDAGSATARNQLRIGSTLYPGATYAPGTSYVWQNATWALNPATTSPFTVAEVDAAQSGIERVS